MMFSIFLIFFDELRIFLLPGNFLVLTVHKETILPYKLPGKYHVIAGALTLETKFSKKSQ